VVIPAEQYGRLSVAWHVLETLDAEREAQR